MNVRNAYRQKIEAEFELIQARLAEFKARGKSLAADAQIQHAQQVDDLEKKVESAKGQLKDLKEANDDVWEQLKAGVERSWKNLHSTIQDIATPSKK